MPPPKKLRSSNEDIISGLPDSIVCHILSMIPTKDAVRTCILSKRWRYTWTSVPNLDFDDACLFVKKNRRRRKKLKKYVMGILLLHCGQIKRLRLTFKTPCLSLHFRNKLICSAIMHQVEELELNIGANALIRLPEILFNCGTLKILTLCGRIVLDKCGSVCLPCLKILSFKHIIKTLHDDVITNIIAGSPVLEKLSIDSHGCYYQKTLSLRSSSLKSLVINSYPYDIGDKDHFRLVLDAPNLQLLEFGDSMSQEHSIDKLHSLVKADVYVTSSFCSFVKLGIYGDRVFQLLSQISNVKDLNLSGSTIKALSKASHCSFPCFSNLTHLKVGAPRAGWFPLLLYQILRCSPNLKALFLIDAVFYDSETIENYFEGENSNRVRWVGEQSVPQCLVSSVERIQLTGFEDANEENMKLIERILMNAIVLKELLVSPGYLASPKEALDNVKKLVTFQRASSTCRISSLPRPAKFN